MHIYVFTNGLAQKYLLAQPPKIFLDPSMHRPMKTMLISVI